MQYTLRAFVIFLILDLGTFTASPVFTVISLIQKKKTRRKTVREHLDVVLKSFLRLEPGLDRHREISNRKHCAFEGSCRAEMGKGSSWSPADSRMATVLVENRWTGDVICCALWQPLAICFGRFKLWLLQNEMCCNCSLERGFNIKKKRMQIPVNNFYIDYITCEIGMLVKFCSIKYTIKINFICLILLF